MSTAREPIRADVVLADAMIAECLTSATVAAREQRLRNAWCAASRGVRLAMTFVLFERAAERGGWQ